MVLTSQLFLITIDKWLMSNSNCQPTFTKKEVRNKSKCSPAIRAYSHLDAANVDDPKLQ